MLGSPFINAGVARVFNSFDIDVKTYLNVDITAFTV
jgi:hypothetical protein